MGDEQWTKGIKSSPQLLTAPYSNSNSKPGPNHCCNIMESDAIIFSELHNVSDGD